MRIAFLGTPAFAIPTLSALREAGHDIAAVYTRAPKPAGRRGLDLTPSPIHAAAEAAGLPVLTPRTLRDDVAIASFRALGAELAVVVGYGMILPSDILAAPRHGCLNLHPSLLPRWRGAAPIQRPIMAGDTETAAAIMKMEEGLDTGPIALEERVPIPPNATAGAMHDTLAVIGARLMVEALRRVDEGTLTYRAQAEDGVVYAPKIEKAEARIDWTKSSGAVHDQIRGLSPSPGAFFEVDLGKGVERIKVLRSAVCMMGTVAEPGDDSLRGPVMVAPSNNEPGMTINAGLDVLCRHGVVRLLEIQRAGKAPITAKAFLSGNKVPAGTRLL